MFCFDMPVMSSRFVDRICISNKVVYYRVQTEHVDRTSDDRMAKKLRKEEQQLVTQTGENLD